MSTGHNIWSLFAAVASRVPDRTAIVSKARRVSYSELEARARRLATVLSERGLGHHVPRSALEPWEAGQDILGIYLLNAPEYLEATLGSYAARVAPANVNYRYVAEELAYLLDDARAGALVYHACFAPTLANVLGRLGRRPLLLQVDDGSGEPLLPGALDYESALENASDQQPMAIGGPPSSDDLYVVYTGGTTGMPKGTLWRQADIFVATLGGDALGADVTEDEIAERAATRRPRSVLPNAPLMHGAAHWIALSSLLVGDALVINDVVDRLDPVDVWSLVERERVVKMLMIGEAFARPLLDELERGDYDTSSLAHVIVGGALTTPETKQRLLSSLPRVTITDTAGASETGGIIRSTAVVGSVAQVGVFEPGETVAVLDPAGRHPVGPGHAGVGWLAKRGAIPLGYLGDREKTMKTFPVLDGERWAVPGDRARLLPDGRVELLGRDSVTINSGGEKIFAEEVERAILLHPDVVDVVVVGRPSERWGQEVTAVVQMQIGSAATDEDLVAVASEHVARYKLPKGVVRVASVLRGPAGKADYAWAARLVRPHAGPTPSTKRGEARS